MISLPVTTKNRLKRLPQLPHVWEGDRVSVGGIMDNIDPEVAEDSDCVIWLDGSDGFVRSMDIVRNTMGQDAMIRCLIKAIENPQNPAQPARPTKIIVKDRELQFLLRGVLQDLDIKVEYQSHLPLIKELWENFYTLRPNKKNNISSDLLNAIEKIALSSIWENQPWDIISEEEIIKITIGHWNIDELYLCVMGMLGEEFGVIMYRSLESLKKFRQTILDLGDSAEEGQLESAFLQQDCWFLNFSEDDDDEFTLFKENFYTNVRPVFGSIHPYEGIRSLKEEEEALPIYIALKALAKFVDECDNQVLDDTDDIIQRQYRFKIPQQKSFVKVNLTTMPEFTKDLETMWDEDDDDDQNENDGDISPAENKFYRVDQDFIPEGTIISFSTLNSSALLAFENKCDDYEQLTSITKNTKQKKFPVIILQTTRPKAKSIIEQLKSENGIKNIALPMGHNQYDEPEYSLGILETPAESLYLFSQYLNNGKISSPINKIEEWKTQVDKYDRNCAVIIAMGATGASRGKPRDKDLLYLFSCQLTDQYQLKMDE